MSSSGGRSSRTPQRRAPLRDLDGADHARGRARAEAGRRRRPSLQAALGGRVRRARENELQELLDFAAQQSESKIERKTDDFGFEWLIIRDHDFEDLVTTVAPVDSELTARGFGSQLLAAVFASTASRDAGLLDLRLQARHLLALRAQRRGAGARQRRGARAQGEAREGAPDRARSHAMAGTLRRADLMPHGAGVQSADPVGHGGAATRAGPTGSRPRVSHGGGARRYTGVREPARREDHPSSPGGDKALKSSIAARARSRRGRLEPGGAALCDYDLAVLVVESVEPPLRAAVTRVLTRRRLVRRPRPPRRVERGEQCRPQAARRGPARPARAS